MVRLRDVELGGELVADFKEIYLRKYFGKYSREDSTLGGL